MNFSSRLSQDECGAIIAECERLAAMLSEKKPGRKLLLGGYVLEFEKELGVVAKWEPKSPDLQMGMEPVTPLSEVLAALAHESRLMGPSKDIVGEEQIELFTEKLNFKRARKGGTVRLHQDYAYWADVAPIAHRVATAMLFLDDATIRKVVWKLRREAIGTGRRRESKGSDLSTAR